MILLYKYLSIHLVVSNIYCKQPTNLCRINSQKSSYSKITSDERIPIEKQSQFQLMRTELRHRFVYFKFLCFTLNNLLLILQGSKVEDIEDSKSIKCRFSVLCARKNIPYEMEASDPKTKNEWVAAVQKCIGELFLYQNKIS